MWIYAGVVLICDGLFLIHFGYAYFMRLYPLLVQFPVFFAFLSVSKFKAIKVFFVHLTVIAITSSFSLIGIIISYFFGSNRAIIYIVCYTLYLPVGFIIYRYLRPSFLYMLRNTEKGWFGFCVIPFSFFAMAYYSGKYNLTPVVVERMIVFGVLLLIMTIAAYALILQIFKQTREHLTMQNEQNLLRMQVKSAQLHLESMKESQEKTIIYRHDMRHHLNLINAYLSDNNKVAAQKYITEVEQTIASAEVEKYCNNYTVNLILYSYIDKAKKVGITVQTQIDLPEENTVSDMDLCIIFANAIENAVNACNTVHNSNDRIIHIVCKTKHGKLFIQITNHYEGKIVFVDDMPVSTEENHGLGTKSIAEVAQKYNGVYSFTAEDGIFKTSIIL
ncbi:MAG: GHKL domain-containing protein [Solirubrobacterales bacterium]